MTESKTPDSEATNPPEASASESSTPDGSTAQAGTPEAVSPAPSIAPSEPAPAPAERGDQVAGEELAELPPAPSSGVFWGTGRRKSAVARVRLIPGEGKILVNKREVDHYFTEPQERLWVHEPLIATKTDRAFNVFVNVRGGGHSGQAGAIRLGVARALTRADARYEPTLREKGYLTRDSRVVERKKYGQRKARRRFQFSKR